MNYYPKPSKPVFKYPRSLQKSIQIKAVHENGIFEHMNEWSVCFALDDINYTNNSMDHRLTILDIWEAMLKTFDNSTLIKITIMNKCVDRDEIIGNIEIPLEGDDKDDWRIAANEMITDNSLAGDHAIRSFIYLTVSVKRHSFDVQSHFNRMENSLKNHLSVLNCNFRRLDTKDRLQIFHDFFRCNEKNGTRLSIRREKQRGHSIKDHIAPSHLDFAKDHFEMQGRFGRALVLQEYGGAVRDNFLSELTSRAKEMVVTFDIMLKSSAETSRIIGGKTMSNESDIEKATSTSVTQFGNYNHNVSYANQKKRDSLAYAAESHQKNEQRIALGQVTVVHLEDDMDKLKMVTDETKDIVSKYECRFDIQTNQQEQSLNTALPYGLRFTQALRTFMTDSAAVMIPFKAREIFHEKGIIMGTNSATNNLIAINRRHKMFDNSNGWVLAYSGSGKSMFIKREIVELFFRTNEDIIIIDPEGEFAELIEALGGTNIRLYNGSPHRINSMEIYQHAMAGDDPVKDKVAFIVGMLKMAVGDDVYSSLSKTLTERCARHLLEDFENGRREDQPTLVDLHHALTQQPEQDIARPLAIALEPFVFGSMNLFASKSNVNMNNRLICFDIRDLSADIKGMGMYSIMDYILTRVTANMSKDVGTRVYCDEIQFLLQYPHIAQELDNWWRRFRKYGGVMTGVTQNVETLLDNTATRTMLANSAYVVMLNQAKNDRDRLTELFDLSEAQQKLIKDAEKGTGILKCKDTIIGFNAKVEKTNKLYEIMSTDFGEDEENGDQREDEDSSYSAN